MKADNTVTITPALIEEWVRDAAAREKQAARLIEEAKGLRARADAGRFLLGLSDEEKTAKADDTGTFNMTADIKKMANESPEPLTKREIKKRLLAAGYSAHRLGAYFYTPIHRLKETKQITVLEDGRIWKAP